MPPPMPTAGSNANDHENYQLLGPRVSTSQPALVLPSLVPSQSLEPLNDRVADNNQNLMRTSVSEPNFGSSPMQVCSVYLLYAFERIVFRHVYVYVVFIYYLLAI